MSTVQRIARNTTVLLVAQAASYFLAFFYGMYTARYLGAESYGVLSFAFAFTAIFGVSTDLGLSLVTVREVARDKSLAPKYLTNVSLMKVILVAVTFGLIALTANLMGYPEETLKVVYLLALVTTFNAFAQIPYSIFQAFERLEFPAIGQMLNAALILGGVLFAITHDFGVIGFASLYLMVSAIVLGYSFAVMKLKFSNPSLASTVKVMEFDWSFWKPTIKEALPFFLTGVCDVIIYRIDRVILSIMKGDAAVGWYSAAFGLVEVLIFIPAALGISIYPVLSRLHTSSQESFELAYQKSFKYLSLLGLPIAVGTTILADRIILGIFGEGFSNSIIALQILIWAIPIIFSSYVFGQMLAATNRQRLAFRIGFICMIANLVMNLVLIPRYSYVGASTAGVITRLMGLVLYLYFFSRLSYRIQIHRLVTKPATASGLMALFLFFFSGLSLWLLVPLAAVMYFGILVLLRAFSKEDLNLFRQILRRK